MSYDCHNVIDSKTHEYCRTFSTQRKLLHEKLIHLYSSSLQRPSDQVQLLEKVQVFPSGMTAVGAVLAQFSADDFVVFGDELYSDTVRTVKYLQKTPDPTRLSMSLKQKKSCPYSPNTMSNCFSLNRAAIHLVKYLILPLCLN